MISTLQIDDTVFQKEEDVGVREEKQFDDEHDVNSYKNRVEKLEKLIKVLMNDFLVPWMKPDLS